MSRKKREVNATEKVEGNFVLVPEKVLFDSRLNATDIKVYGTLKSFMNHKTRQCYPTRKTMEEKSKVSPRTITSSTAKLSRCGHILIIPQFNSSNIYTIL